MADYIMAAVFSDGECARERRVLRSNVVSRLQRRWSGRLRMAGALMLLLGVVGLVDAIALARSLGGAGAAGLFMTVGGGLFVVGRRWG